MYGSRLGSAPQKTVEGDALIWDKIVKEKEDFDINVHQLTRCLEPQHKDPCMIKDLNKSLRGNNVTITLYWDLMPTVGLLKKGGSHSVKQITMPTNFKLAS